jgi:hypothetical protein
VSRSFLCGVGCHAVSRYFGICWISSSNFY